MANDERVRQTRVTRVTRAILEKYHRVEVELGPMEEERLRVWLSSYPEVKPTPIELLENTGLKFKSVELEELYAAAALEEPEGSDSEDDEWALNRVPASTPLMLKSPMDEVDSMFTVASLLLHPRIASEVLGDGMEEIGRRHARGASRVTLLFRGGVILFYAVLQSIVLVLHPLPSKRRE